MVHVFCKSSHSALHLCEVYGEIKEPIRVHSINGYFQYLLCSKGYNSKGRSTRVTFFVFCKLPYIALHL